jgi:hypothetical protein
MGATPHDVSEFDAGGHRVVLGTHALRPVGPAGGGRTAAAPFVLGDSNTLRHCLPELLAHVPLLRKAETIAIQPGEGSKSIAVCHDIWSHLIAQRGRPRHRWSW